MSTAKVFHAIGGMGSGESILRVALMWLCLTAMVKDQFTRPLPRVREDMAIRMDRSTLNRTFHSFSVHRLFHE